VVALAKPRDYCLSETYPRGKHKARVFRSRLRLTAADAELLRKPLSDAARDRHAELRPTDSDEYGQRYVLDIEMITTAGTATRLRSARSGLSSPVRTYYD
jgi:hypothetical protein